MATRQSYICLGGENLEKCLIVIRRAVIAQASDKYLVFAFSIFT